MTKAKEIDKQKTKFYRITAEWNVKWCDELKWQRKKVCDRLKE